MRRTARIRRQRRGAILLFLLFSLLTTPLDARAKDAAAFLPGELIVQVQDSIDLQRLMVDFAPHQLHTVKCLSQRMNIWLLGYQDGGMKASDHPLLLDDVRVDPRVVEAQFNHRMQLRATVPDDPSFGLQWALNNTGQSGGTPDADIDAPEAWDLATGGTTALGEQIVVAIIDAGFDLNHQDVAYFKNTLEIPGNGIDDDGNGYIDDYNGWNVYNSSGNLPVDSHGQHVAGIAGAKGNNAIGIAGVNWGVKIMPIAGSTELESEAIEAYGYVQAMRALYNETGGAKGAFVVSTNASFGVDYGDPADFPLWCGIYDSLGAVGVLSAGATANIGMDIDINGDIPTACPSDYLISVTNTTRLDVRNSGAAWGLTTIDLGAPGTAIYSTLPGNTYGNLTGTSMATPHVAGAVALMYAAACPGFIAQYKSDPAGTALLVKQAILDGADPNASLAGKTVSGGRLNVYHSMVSVRAYDCGTEIIHTPLTDTKDAIDDYEVVCEIYTDTTLNPATAELHYSIGAIEQIETFLPTGNPAEYHAFIPAQSAGTTIDYWLTAADYRGDADTTATYSFRVIDYDVVIAPASAGASGPQYTTAEYDLTITNNGVLADEFDLSVLGNTWPTVIYDAPGVTPIGTTGALAPDAAIDIKVMVDIPASYNGATDAAEIRATSTGDPAIAASATLTTTSTGGPLALPFYEPFPSTSPDIGLWTVSSGITINTTALGEPSAPYAANFNGTPGGADTLVSQVIDLDGLSGVVLSYAYEQTGGGESPDAGDDLYVEFYNDAGSWELLNHYPGADADMANFAAVHMDLPVSAYHSAFRLRIRNTATVGAFDDWFVDDVRIDYPAQTSVTPVSIAEELKKPDSVSVDLTLTNAGQGTLDFSVILAPAARAADGRAALLTVSPLSGSVDGGGFVVLTVWLRSADSDTGFYSYAIEVHSNDFDPEDNPWIVPVNVHVTDCACPNQSDFDDDGYTTALDLARLIDVLFVGAPNVKDPICPFPRGDFDCDGYSTALDLSGLIDHLFVGGVAPCDPCGL